MRSLPLRARLLLSYSLTMLIVFVAAGAFVYVRVESALDRSLQGTLNHAVSVIRPLYRGGRIHDVNDATATGTAWQLLTPGLIVTQYGGRAGPLAMVTTPRAGMYDVRGMPPRHDQSYRVRVVRLGGDYLAVAVSTSRRNVALRELLLQLAIAGLVAMGLAALVGERLAYFALRPVESYRRQVAAIARGATGVRLDVPPHRNDEVTRLGVTLNQMLAALERAFEHERRFVSEASHELRTPLTLLKSRIQLTRRRTRTVAEHEHVLAELDLDVASLVELAQQLLELGTSYPDGVADLGAAAVAVADRHRQAHQGPDAQPEVMAEVRGEHLVPLAAVILDRIVTNLVDNALTHGRPPVTMIVDRRKGWSRLCVSDPGDGMPPDLLGSATERFARSPEARSRRGAGLGLSLVERLVTDAGGELRLCFRGHHERRGVPVPVACDHTDAMTVTVLLPAAGQRG